jgi:hypothetical protein
VGRSAAEVSVFGPQPRALRGHVGDDIGGIHNLISSNSIGPIAPAGISPFPVSA